MCSVDVHGSGGTDTVADEGGPFYRGGLFAEFDEFCDGVCVEKTEVSGFDLPGLVLACAG